jgi:hypothetical protein
MSESFDLWVIAETEPIETTATTGSRDGEYTGPSYGKNNDILQKITRKRIPVDVALLKAQMSGMPQVVNELLTQAEAQTGMKLSEVELKVEISAEGQLSLVGNGLTKGGWLRLAGNVESEHHAPKKLMNHPGETPSIMDGEVRRSHFPSRLV